MDNHESQCLDIDAWLEKGEIPFNEGLPIQIIRERIYRMYEPSEVKGIVVLLHGIQSHSGWFTRSCTKLAADGYLVIAPDRRGSGGYTEYRGDIDSCEHLVADIDTVIAKLKEDFPNVPIYLMGVSWGGKLALFYGILRPSMVDGLILSTPGIKVKPDLSLLDKLKVGIALALGKGGQLQLRIPIDIPHLFTDDSGLQEWIKNDGRTLRSCSARFYFESKRIDNFLERNIGLCCNRILLMLAGRDDIIDNVRTIDFLIKCTANSGFPIEAILYPHARHTLDFEANWEVVVTELTYRLNTWNNAILAGAINGHLKPSKTNSFSRIF